MAVVAASLTLAPAALTPALSSASAASEIEAHWSRVDASTLRTRLARGRASVSTVEHLLAALAGLRVDNALVLVDGDEIPAMDGSAPAFVAAIDEVGIVDLPGAATAAGASSGRSRVSRRRRLGRAAPRRKPACSLDVEIAFAGPDRAPAPVARRSRRKRFRARIAPAPQFRVSARRGASCGARGWRSARRSTTPWFWTARPSSIRRACVSPTNACATRCSTSSATWRLPARRMIGAFRSYRGGHGLNHRAARSCGATRRPGARAWTRRGVATETPAAASPRHNLARRRSFFQPIVNRSPRAAAPVDAGWVRPAWRDLAD